MEQAPLHPSTEVKPMQHLNFRRMALAMYLADARAEATGGKGDVASLY